MPDAIRIGDPAIEIRLRRNARARRMVLRVARLGQPPTLTLPPGVPLDRARAFAADQEGWLRRQLAAAPAGRAVAAGTVLPFRGATLRLSAVAGRRIILEGDALRVPGEAGDLPVRVAAFLKEQSRQACLAAAEAHAGRIGKPFRRISLRDPRGRWGSCSAQGDLMFSWRLILAPPAVLDYVVVHEVAHLAEFSHAPEFWDVVRALMPEYAVPRGWLRRNGAGLHAWDFGSRA